MSSLAIDDAGPGWRAAFEMAWASWRSGSMGIGAVLVAADGSVVARGRNRVLEEPGSGPVAGTLLAHAEMDAFAALGVRTAAGLSLLTTVEPCLMCSATSIAMRLDRVTFAAADPVFEGLDAALASHPYCAERRPDKEALGSPLLGAVATVLPFAHRVWSRPGEAPRPEWLGARRTSWDAAVELVAGGVLPALAASEASLDDVVERIAPVLTDAGAA